MQVYATPPLDVDFLKQGIRTKSQPAALAPADTFISAASPNFTSLLAVCLSIS
jgi:hypothetical protein